MSKPRRLKSSNTKSHSSSESQKYILVIGYDRGITRLNILQNIGSEVAKDLECWVYFLYSSEVGPFLGRILLAFMKLQFPLPKTSEYY